MRKPMPLTIILLEVMDKEPPLALILLTFLGVGGAGMLAGRRRPILCVPFFAIVFVFGFGLFLELHDPFVGPAIRQEGGLSYVALSYLAILAGIVMPFFGAVIGARRVGNGSSIWRWISGSVGVLLLGLTIYLGYAFGQNAYYSYYVLPKLEARGDIIMYVEPMQWQEAIADGTILMGLLAGSVWSLRSAFRPTRLRESPRPAH